MTFEEIIQNRNEQIQKRIELEAKVSKARKTLANAEKRLAKQEDKCSRFETILYPLIDEIKKRCGFKYADIYGPFGMTCETSIYFSNEGEKGGRNGKKCDNIEITKVDTYGITLCPNDKYKSGYEYYTGETTNDYKEGSIGWLNGMNNICKELPCDIDEVIKLLTFTKGREDE